MMTRSRGPVMLVAAVVCSAAFAWGQSKDVKDLGMGKLMVAARGLPDPNFVESVVLLIQYDQQGTVGLMINRRTRAPISRVLQDLNTAKDRSHPAYHGGPVELTAVFGLSRSRKKLDGATSLLSEVYLVSSKALLDKALATSSGPADFRLYLGYCGWAGGQLENEVRHDGWWIFDANPGLVFDSNPDSVWSRLIARTEEQIAEAVVVRSQLP